MSDRMWGYHEIEVRVDAEGRADAGRSDSLARHGLLVGGKWLPTLRIEAGNAANGILVATVVIDPRLGVKIERDPGKPPFPSGPIPVFVEGDGEREQVEITEGLGGVSVDLAP